MKKHFSSFAGTSRSTTCHGVALPRDLTVQDYAATGKARVFSEKNYNHFKAEIFPKVRETFAVCFWFRLLGAVVYMMIIILFRSRIIYLVGGDENDFQYVSSYMFWTMIAGAIPTVGNVLCGHLVRSIGASKEAGIGMSMGGILNIILDPIFMFVILPEGMEVTGAAMATLISNTTAFVYFLIYIKRRDVRPAVVGKTSKATIVWGSAAGMKAVGTGTEAGATEQSQTNDPGIINLKLPEAGAIWPVLSPVLLIGFPAALQTTLAMVSNIFVNVLIRPYGSSAVAGMGVAKKNQYDRLQHLHGHDHGCAAAAGIFLWRKKYQPHEEHNTLHWYGSGTLRQLLHGGVRNRRA